MNYNDIVSQISSRLGYTGFSDGLRADIRHAVSWAEHEILTETGISSKSDTLTIKSDSARYDLPDDFAEPSEVLVYDTTGVKLASRHVTYDQWMRWDPTSTSNIPGTDNDVLDYEVDTKAFTESRYLSRRVVVAINYEDGQYYLNVKPAIDGLVVINYSQKSPENIFLQLTLEPPIPSNFHHFIIDGAVHYLAQNEAARAQRENNPQKAIFYTRISESAYQLFHEHKEKIVMNSKKESEWAVARGDGWFENPRKYVRNRSHR